MSDHRFEDLERYAAAAVRAGLPAVVMEWLAPARARLEVLTRSAVDPEVDDETFLQMVRRAAAELPELMEELGTTSLAEYFEAAMGAAAVAGMTARGAAASGQRTAVAGIDGEYLPWSIVEAARRKMRRGERSPNQTRKPFDETLHPRGAAGRFTFKPGAVARGGREAVLEWREADAAEAALLSRLTGRGFKPGALILAREGAMLHVEHHHKHQLSEKDFKQLRGRLFDPRTERALTRTANHEDAIAFRFLRGEDRMEAIFTIHFPHRKSPGELRLKTYAQRS